MDEHENGIFQIQDDQGAEWALKKIREAREEQAKWTDFYQGRMNKVKTQTQETIQFMEGLLRQYFAQSAGYTFAACLLNASDSEGKIKLIANKYQTGV